jgi:hypothetical protein
MFFDFFILGGFKMALNMIIFIPYQEPKSKYELKSVRDGGLLDKLRKLFGNGASLRRRRAA